jgi:hypothetical protein
MRVQIPHEVCSITESDIRIADLRWVISLLSLLAFHGSVITERKTDLPECLPPDDLVGIRFVSKRILINRHEILKVGVNFTSNEILMMIAENALLNGR